MFLIALTTSNCRISNWTTIALM